MNCHITARLGALLLTLLGITAVAAPAFADDPVQSALASRSGVALSGAMADVLDSDDIVVLDVTPLSVSQCPSGKFCIWGSTNYSGTLVTKSGDGSTLTISSSVYSVWNNRSYGARLYGNDGSTSLCLAPGAKQPSLAATYHRATKVRLSSTSSC